MVFIFLTPQPNNYSAMIGTDVKVDLISTLKAISNGKTVATYQTCLDSLRVATSLVTGKIQIVLSNGSIIEVGEKDNLEDIMELEKEAIAEAFDTPKDELKARTNINEIKINAMDFYQAAYCDENDAKIEDDMVEIIKQTKEKENTNLIYNELEAVDRIITSYDIKGKIQYINCNGDASIKEEDFFNILKKIIINGDINRGQVSFWEGTKDLNYIITFDSGTKILRKNMEFSVIEK